MLNFKSTWYGTTINSTLPDLQLYSCTAVPSILEHVLEHVLEHAILMTSFDRMDEVVHAILILMERMRSEVVLLEQME